MKLRPSTKGHTVSLVWTRGETCYWNCTCGDRGLEYYTIGRAGIAAAEREHQAAFPSLR